MKLREFLQQEGLSRRAITSFIDDGKIFINGDKVQSYGVEINFGDQIFCGDKKWEYKQNSDVKKSELIMFYKPIGYVCSKSDPHNTTIYELLPKNLSNYYYIGRLDKDSRGLVLLTNDSKLVDKYEHPSNGITKEYLVTLNKNFHKEDIKRCLDGIENDGDVLKSVELSILDNESYEKYKKYLLPDLIKTPSCVIRMVLNEGKKRHIRRMMSTLRYHVEDLVRISEGGFGLGDLKEGEIRIV